MAISLALAVIGAIIVFAINGHEGIAGMPWLDVHAMGWVMLIIGALSFIIAAAAAGGGHRWFGRFFGGGE